VYSSSSEDENYSGKYEGDKRTGSNKSKFVNTSESNKERRRAEVDDIETRKRQGLADLKAIEEEKTKQSRELGDLMRKKRNEVKDELANMKRLEKVEKMYVFL